MKIISDTFEGAKRRTTSRQAQRVLCEYIYIYIYVFFKFWKKARRSSNHKCSKMMWCPEKKFVCERAFARPAQHFALFGTPTHPKTQHTLNTKPQSHHRPFYFFFSHTEIQIAAALKIPNRFIYFFHQVKKKNIFTLPLVIL